MKQATSALLILFILLTFSTIPAPGQTWQDFAHPGTPHLNFPSYPHLPLSIPGLLQGPGDTIKQVPLLVVLLEFNDIVHDAQHPFQFWKDLIYGPSPLPVPSLVEYYQEISNGRLLLVPAAAGDRFDGAPDGVIGWVRSPKNLLTPLMSPNQKRAEGIIMADPMFDFSTYDTNGDGIITNDELAIVVVFSEPYCCDQHPGHIDRPGCNNCPGGNSRTTDPAYIPVDSGTKQVYQLVSGIDEIANVNVAAHEFGHTLLGHGDLYYGACSLNTRTIDGFFCADMFNDACSNAACIEGGSDVCAWGINAAATGSGSSSCGGNDSNDLWFRYTPNLSAPVTITTCSNFNTTLSVFDSCDGIELACNDYIDINCDLDSEIEKQSQVSLFMNAGMTYWIRLAGKDNATGNYQITISPNTAGSCGYNPTDPRWYPVTPVLYSLMDSDFYAFPTHLDPWAKIHLGFVKPKIITRDGRYHLYDAETLRNFSLQDSQPQALILHDPLKENPLREYFILENRNTPALPDQGLAVWLINENGPTWPNNLNLKKVSRLIRRGGHWANDGNALWDGSNANDGNDFTAFSTPRDSNWTDYSPSYIEVSNISPAGTVMTMDITMPPLFVDRSFSGVERGSQSNPFNTLPEAISAIPEPPRTVRIAGGNYPGSLLINSPCKLKGWKNGSAFIGKTN